VLGSEGAAIEIAKDGLDVEAAAAHEVFHFARGNPGARQRQAAFPQQAVIMVALFDAVFLDNQLTVLVVTRAMVMDKPLSGVGDVVFPREGLLMGRHDPRRPRRP